jgi:hypothetical protein
MKATQMEKALMEANLKVESGIPLPKKRSSGITMAMRMMKIGDSFIMDSEKSGSLASSAKCAEIKVTMLKISKSKHRVWRIK